MSARLSLNDLDDASTIVLANVRVDVEGHRRVRVSHSIRVRSHAYARRE
jgi:hypothetical protein